LKGLQAYGRADRAVIYLPRWTPSLCYALIRLLRKRCCANTFGKRVFAPRFVNKPANPCIDNRPSQNLSGAYVHVPGFWCGPELDRFVWDKDCGGIVNEGRTQNLPAVLTARLQAETPSLRMGSGGLPQVVEFKTPRSIVAAGPYSAYD
jgi:hypothetical protein